MGCIKKKLRTSLAVQWLRLCASHAGGYAKVQNMRDDRYTHKHVLCVYMY